MVLRASLLLAAALAGCGGAPPAPSRPAPDPIEVPPPSQDAEETDVGVVEESGARAATAASLVSCIEALRRAPDVEAEAADAERYERGYLHEQRGELTEARRAYFELVQHGPKSRLVPLAYLAFAELFAADAASDPSKWELARAAYREVSKYPAPGNPAWTYAMLRSADVERATSKHQEALAGYVKVVTEVRRRPGQPCSEALAAEARRGAVLAYAEVGRPERAHQVFHHADPETSDAWLADLVDELMRRGSTREACAAARAAPESARAARERVVCP